MCYYHFNTVYECINILLLYHTKKIDSNYISRKGGIILSNLGWYQKITQISKKLGGPKNFIASVFGIGVVVGGTAAVFGNSLVKHLTNKKADEEEKLKSQIIYKVLKNGKSNEGLILKEGDLFKVIEKDGDVGLIEILEDNNNPHYISLSYLKLISNYIEK